MFVFSPLRPGRGQRSSGPPPSPPIKRHNCRWPRSSPLRAPHNKKSSGWKSLPPPPITTRLFLLTRNGPDRPRHIHGLTSDPSTRRPHAPKAAGCLGGEMDVWAEASDASDAKWKLERGGGESFPKVSRHCLNLTSVSGDVFINVNKSYKETKSNSKFIPLFNIVCVCYVQNHIWIQIYYFLMFE